MILIGGAQRSGTTLLQTLLANALGAPILPEAHILCDLMESYKRAKDAPRKTQYFYADDEELLAFFRACAERHIGDLTRRLDGADNLVLKDPNFVQFDDAAASMLPHAVRIVCLRDPRDIAASFLRIGQRETHGEAGKYRRRDIHFIGKKIVEAYGGLVDRRAPNLHASATRNWSRPRRTRCGPSPATPGSSCRSTASTDPVWLESGARHDPAWVSHLEEAAPSTESVGSYRKAMSAREIALIAADFCRSHGFRGL